MNTKVEEYFLDLYDKGSWDSLINDDGGYFGHLFADPFASPFVFVDACGPLTFFQVGNREFCLEEFSGSFDLREI